MARPKKYKISLTDDELKILKSVMRKKKTYAFCLCHLPVLAVQSIFSMRIYLTICQRKNSRNLSGEKLTLQNRRVLLCKINFAERKRSM